jgi:uncharacterized protein YjdB
MSRKMVFLIEIIVCIIAVVIVSLIGVNPEIWKVYTPVSSVSFTNTEITFTENKKIITIKSGTKNYTLTYSVLPSNATNSDVSFSSSDESIATVDNNGVVNIIRETGFNIIIIAKDGTKKSDSVSFIFSSSGGGGIDL